MTCRYGFGQFQSIVHRKICFEVIHILEAGRDDEVRENTVSKVFVVQANVEIDITLQLSAANIIPLRISNYAPTGE